MVDAGLTEKVSQDKVSDEFSISNNIKGVSDNLKM